MSEARYSVRETTSTSIVGGAQGGPGDRTVPKGCYSIHGEWILYSVEPPYKEAVSNEPWHLLPEDREMPVVPVYDEQGDVKALEMELAYDALTSRVELARIRRLAGEIIEMTLNHQDANEHTNELSGFLSRDGMIEAEEWLTELPEL